MFPKLSNGFIFLRCTFARIHSGCFSYFSLSSPTHRFNNLQQGDLTFFRLQNCTAINKQILHVHVTLQDLKPKGKRKTGSIDTPPAFPASLGFLILQIPLNSKTTLKPLHFHRYASARTVNRSQNISTHLSQELFLVRISNQPHNPKSFQTGHQYWHAISRKWGLEITWSNLLLLFT